MNKDYSVVPIVRAGYDARIVYPTQFPLALQARQSTKKQSIHNQESYESQTTVLLENAQDMGWRGIGDDIIPFIENRRKDGKIVDASGAKRVDERPTMQDLWYHIEHDLVKAVMCRGVDRLFRQVAMVEPAQFADLCRRHQCIVITVKEVRRRTRIDVYNFHENPEDIGAFLAEAQAGADFLLNQIEWMQRCRLNKAMRGDYDGRAAPIGYLLDDGTFVVYKPHACIVRWLFRRYRELVGNFHLLWMEVIGRIRTQGYLFPLLPEEMSAHRMTLGQTAHGYTITQKGLRTLLCNTSYLGWWLAYETVDRGLPTERKVLRARIEDHHEGIVPPADFWYAHDKLVDQPRSRYNKVGTVSCEALLEDIVTSDIYPVYVYQTAQEPEKATYQIANPKAYWTDTTHGSVYVKVLDRLFTDHLLERLEAGKRLLEQYPGELFEGELMVDQIEDRDNFLIMEFAGLVQQQEVAVAGIDANLPGYIEEAESLQRTLHYGSKKLDGQTIERYAERLAQLHVTIAQLQEKQKRAAAAQEALAKFGKKLEDVPMTWKEMDFHEKRRFIQLVCEKITLHKVAPNWLQLAIHWIWDDVPTDVLYIWQRKGSGEAWTDEEEMILRRLYPGTDRATVLEALPRRNWVAIVNRAYDLGIARAYQWNNSSLPKVVSVDDAAFMAHVGIDYAPGQRFWWKIAKETEGTSSGQTHDDEDFFDCREVTVYSQVPENNTHGNDKPHPGKTCNQLHSAPNSNQVSCNQGDISHNQNERGRNSKPTAIVLTQDFS